MIRVPVSVPLLVLALALAACGADDATVDVGAVGAGGGQGIAVGEPAPGTNPGGAVDQPIPVEPDGGIGGPVGAPLVEPRPGTANTRARPYDDVHVGEDGVTLTIFYTSGVEPCYVLDRVEVEETESRVTLTLFEGSDPDQPDATCIEIAEQKATQVRLEAPIGDRTLVDGAA